MNQYEEFILSLVNESNAKAGDKIAPAEDKYSYNNIQEGLNDAILGILAITFIFGTLKVILENM